MILRTVCSALLLVVSVVAPSGAQENLDELAIAVNGTSRGFVYTNKKNAFFFGETAAGHPNSWQGWHVSRRKVLDDYVILVDGRAIQRWEAISVTVRPDFLVREYADGLREEVRFVDSLAIMAVHLSSPEPVEFGFVPLITGVSNQTDYPCRFETDRMVIGLGTQPEFRVVLQGDGFTPMLTEYREDGRASNLMLHAARSVRKTIAIAVDTSEATAGYLAGSYRVHAARYARERRARMESLLSLTAVQTDNTQFNIALCWAKLSLDALIMDEGRKGIYAGLPWFNNYWGRDTFISLPGALLVTGRFSEAKEILLTFARLQNTETASPNYGRIPNVVNPEEVSYNTADGTPRFVIMAREYIERSGDTSFLAEIYPSVLRAIDGTVRYHTDSLMLLTHADAETWMDAVGPDGPWTPRGNRANDVQALWIEQLQAGIWFALQVGDAISAQSWENTEQRAAVSFRKHFVRAGQMVDHLHPDRSADMKVRPNQIFTAHLLDDTTRASVVQTVTERLAYAHGVASLSPSDSGFHPFHNNPPLYPKDAAYHNGTVWTWLQGPLISELCFFAHENLAFRLTKNSVHQILDRGAVGTQSELLDAVPHPGEPEPRLSGTVSQAWNLAEFVRNFYDDYLGIRLTRYNHIMQIRPRLPEELGDVAAVINLEGRSVPVSIRRTAKSFDITVDAGNLRRGGMAELILPLGSSGKFGQGTLEIRPGDHVTISATDVGFLVMKDGGITMLPHSVVDVPTSLIPKTLNLLTPVYRSDIPVLKGPGYALLPHSIIKETNPGATNLVALHDEEEDDNGTGRYVYPLHPSHIDGSFDLKRFSVDIDDRNAYFTVRFRTLSNPGWHPEYGFQLTCVAIALDTDGKLGTGETSVGYNSGFTLPVGFGYERLVLVGGGVQLEDEKGKILAAYIPEPADFKDPLGNAAEGEISFALPLEHLGKPDPKWRFAILVGGQDDHGGAGIGEFRRVDYEAGEWIGGGRLSESDSNIYDTLITPPR